MLLIILLFLFDFSVFNDFMLLKFFYFINFLYRLNLMRNLNFYDILDFEFNIRIVMVVGLINLYDLLF